MLREDREGVFVQVYLVMAMKALTQAFLMWQEEQARLHELGEDTSWRCIEESSKCSIAITHCLHRILLWDLSLPRSDYAGDVPVHKTAKELGVTRASIYTKYTGLSPP